MSIAPMKSQWRPRWVRRLTTASAARARREEHREADADRERADEGGGADARRFYREVGVVRRRERDARHRRDRDGEPRQQVEEEDRRQLERRRVGGRAIFNRSSWNFFHEPLPHPSELARRLRVHPRDHLLERDRDRVGRPPHRVEEPRREDERRGDEPRRPFVVRPCTVPSLWKAQYSVSRIICLHPRIDVRLRVDRVQLDDRARLHRVNHGRWRRTRRGRTSDRTRSGRRSSASGRGKNHDPATKSARIERTDAKTSFRARAP